MRTKDWRSYQLEPVVIGRGVDEFASEDEFAAVILEIEDATPPPSPVVMDFVSEAEAPLREAAPTALPERPRASIKSWVQVRAIASSAAVMMAVCAGVVGAWMALRVPLGIAFVSRAIASGRARRRMAWKSLGASAAAVRGAVRRGRLAMSTAAEMMAVAAGVVGAWLVIRVFMGIAFVSRVIESAQARRRLAWESLGAQRAGAVALLHRRGAGAIAGLAVAALAAVFAMPSNPPAVSPVAAVSTSAGTPAPQTAADIAGSRQIDPPAAALRPEPFPAAASLERPGVPATLNAAAQSAGPEPQNTVYGGRTAGPQLDTPSRPPVLLAVVNRDSPGTPAAEPLPVPVATVSAALEAPKPAAAEPAAAEPAANVPAVVVTAASTVATDRSAIDDLLSAYRRSYNSLDASAVSSIWRGADTRALTRAFSTLTRQHITFDRCDVRVTGADRARARCDGILSYVQKAGDTTPQQRRVSWSIDLGRPDDRWVIVGVEAR